MWGTLRHLFHMLLTWFCKLLHFFSLFSRTTSGGRLSQNPLLSPVVHRTWNSVYYAREIYFYMNLLCLFEAKPTSSLFECLTQTTPWRNCGFYVCVYWLIASLYNKVNLYSARLAAIILRQHHYFALCMKLQLFLKQGKSWKLVQYDMAKHCTSVYAMLCKW